MIELPFGLALVSSTAKHCLILDLTLAEHPSKVSTTKLYSCTVYCGNCFQTHTEEEHISVLCLCPSNPCLKSMGNSSLQNNSLFLLVKQPRSIVTLYFYTLCIQGDIPVSHSFLVLVKDLGFSKQVMAPCQQAQSLSTASKDYLQGSIVMHLVLTLLYIQREYEPVS